ncbi:MAG: hypothetical protein HYU52_03000 [Acidobacteria bacterium]|nr:hypothetical protein [Acidobacteriota bacterium]
MPSRSAQSQSLGRLFELLNLLAERRPRVDGLPPTLTAAAWRGDLESVDLFLAQGARLDEESIGCSSPLAGAIRSGRADVVARLLEAGARPDSRGAADMAASRGRIDLLEQLFDAGLDPTSACARNAVVSAAIVGQATAMRALAARGVQANPVDVNFAAGLSESNGHAAIAAFLRGTLASLDGVRDAEPAQLIIPRERLPRDEDAWPDDRLERDAIEIVLSGTIDSELSSTDDRGLSPLAAAVDARSVSMVKALLDRGANPHWSGGRSIDGREQAYDAPVVMAAADGLVPVVELLAGNARAADRGDALARACGFGDPSSVEALLRAGADPSFVTEGGESPLSKARGPHRDTIRKLVREELKRRGVSPGPALANEGAKPRKRGGALRGVSEFVQSQVELNPDWCVLAIRAPIELVTPRLTELLGAEAAELDVARRGVFDVAAGAFVLQVLGQPWTIELHSMGFHHVGRFELDDRRVALVSQALSCEAVRCAGSDASGTFTVSRYERGALSEVVEFTFEGDPYAGDAEDERVVPASARNLIPADQWFAARELFLPGCRIDPSGAGPRLMLSRVDPAAIGRVDVLILER